MNPEGTEFLDASRLKLFGNFETQVSQLLTDVRLSRQEVEAMQLLMNDVSRTLNQYWPGCRVYPFGSIVTGLGIRTSDIDLYVELPPFVKNDNQLVYKVKKYLQWEGYLFKDITAIPMAKVPIVKFYHGPTDRYCDVNFTSLAGVKNTSLLAYLLHVDPRVLPLAIILKFWSKVHNLTGTYLMPNYALTLLTIFYLQQNEILPLVSLLQDSLPEVMVENWNTAFRTEQGFFSNVSQSLYELLGGFFEFYSNFDYANQVICLYLGKPLPKTSFTGIENLPDDYGLYKSNLSRKICRPLKVNSPMCIQDPFDHSRNCAVAVHFRLFNKIMAFFKNSAKLYREVDSQAYLKAILSKFDYKEPESPKPLLHHAPGRIQKRKHINRKQQNRGNNIYHLNNKIRNGKKKKK